MSDTSSPVTTPSSSDHAPHANAAASSSSPSSSVRAEIRFLTFFFAFAAMSVGALFLLYRSIWIPIILGVVAALLLEPMVEKIAFKTKLPRWSIAISTITAFLLLIPLALYAIIPILINQIREILSALSNTLDFIQDYWRDNAPENLQTGLQRLIQSLGLEGFDRSSISEFLTTLSFEQILDVLRRIGDIGNAISTLVYSSIPAAIGICIGPCVMYVTLRHAPTIRTRILELVPPHFAPSVKSIATRLFDTLRQVILGQIYVAFTLGILYAIGYSILGIKAGFAIGIAAGVGRLIPYMDMVTALILSATVILSAPDPLTPLIGSVLIITIVSLIDAMIVTPRLIGSSAGIHPIIVLCSIIAFSSLLGFWGIVIAIPIVAMTKEAITIALEYYKTLNLAPLSAVAEGLTSAAAEGSISAEGSRTASPDPTS